MTTYYKQSNERLDYDIDYTLWLPEGDAVIETVVSVDPVGLDVALSDGATAIPKLWVGGGLDRVNYVVSVTCVTQYGRTKEINFKLKVKDI
jgi:hypothetical protein